MLRKNDTAKQQSKANSKKELSLFFPIALFNLIRNKIHRYRINAMPRILLCESFTFENVTQVCTAISALNFRANSVRIGQTFHCAWNFIVEAGPTAVGFELVLRTVERCAASFADVGPALPERVIFACEGFFCAFVDDYAFFFFGEFVWRGFLF